ncbi:hypothetical protein VaNZ11_005123 [Volvox africanus]|uniref:J domain-containing protein n=1 Tax=Volvox africanus TaxID=51714 RepID=A0ABQ5RY07_9CHLO|nr:hypothetical protein VaNZ11_005123 [Volvox africanus]
MKECLYEVLGLSKGASQEEIKKAYRQRALQLHPDKNPGNEDAKAKFQLLQKVYAILGDEEKRKVYDQTGSTDDDELAGAGFDSMMDYFRAMCTIKTEDIEDFTARFQGSVDERSDLLRYYNQFRGRMEIVFDHLMCSDPVFDSHRLRDILEEAIAAGEVERFKPYTTWAKSVAARPRPPARRLSAGVAGPSNALIAAIHGKRAAAADSFFDALAAKYGGSAGRGKEKGKERKVVASAKQVAEPTESEFEEARRRLEDRQAFKPSGATSKEEGKRSKGKSKSGAAVTKKSRRSHAGSGDGEEHLDVVTEGEEEEGGMGADIGEGHNDSPSLNARRPTKKARNSGGGRASGAADDDVADVEHQNPAGKKKRKSGAQPVPAAVDGASDGERAEKAACRDCRRPLKAKHGVKAATSAAVTAEDSSAATKGSEGCSLLRHGAWARAAKDKEEGRASGANCWRGAEKENKGATPATGKKSKGKDKRLSGADGQADGHDEEKRPSKKVKRTAA